MKASNLAALLAIAPAAVAAWTWPEAEGKSIRFTSVPGYFVQDDNATDPTGFDYVSDHFIKSPALQTLTEFPGCGQLRPDRPDIPYGQTL